MRCSRLPTVAHQHETTATAGFYVDVLMMTSPCSGDDGAVNRSHAEVNVATTKGPRGRSQLHRVNQSRHRRKPFAGKLTHVDEPRLLRDDACRPVRRTDHHHGIAGTRFTTDPEPFLAKKPTQAALDVLDVEPAQIRRLPADPDESTSGDGCVGALDSQNVRCRVRQAEIPGFGPVLRAGPRVRQIGINPVRVGPARDRKDELREPLTVTRVIPTQRVAHGVRRLCGASGVERTLWLAVSRREEEI